MKETKEERFLRRWKEKYLEDSKYEYAEELFDAVGGKLLAEAQKDA